MNLSMSSVCPVCSRGASSTSAQIKSYRIVYCDGCALWFLYPPPTEHDVENFYNQSYYKVAADSIHGVMLADAIRMASGKTKSYHQVLSTLRRLGARDHLLDVGCALGQFLVMAQQHGFSPTGIEYNHLLAKQAGSYGLDVVAGDYLAANWQASSFDVITFWYVLEHVTHPAAVLKRTRQLLATDGIVYIRVPNMLFGLPFLWLTRLGWSRFPSIFSHIPAHLFFFQPRALKNLLTASGFEVMRIEHGEPVYSPSSAPQNLIANLARFIAVKSADVVVRVSGQRLWCAPSFSIYARRIP